VNKRKKRVLTVVVVMLTVGILLETPLAVAQHFNPDLDLPKPTGFEKVLTKLGRGISNILLGWAEIPVTWDRKLKEGQPLGYLVGVAPVLGTARAVVRTGTGVFEVVTFPFSDHDVNYEAVLEPEFIF